MQLENRHKLEPLPFRTGGDSMSYSSNTTNYVPPSQYYSTPHASSNQQFVAPISQPDTVQRKRPKYTRSKTGCLTCRVKKIKCDETKPACIRCTHGQRECTWPEGVSNSKRTSSRKPTVEGLDGRPSTAGSSGVSEGSTPPTRNHTPPDLIPADIGIPPLASRRHSEPYHNQLAPPAQYARRQSADRGPVMPNYPTQHSSSAVNAMSMIPEASSYPIDPRYDQFYKSTMNPGTVSISRHSNIHNNIRSGDRQPLVSQTMPTSQSNWNPSIMTGLDPIEPFFTNAQERNLIHHYCDNSLSIIMAVPLASENPIVAANLPLVLSRPSGSDHSTEALRMALLGVAAIHQSYLLTRNRASPDRASEMARLAQGYKMNSRSQLTKACSTAEGVHSDASLAASIAIALMDMFAGGQNWTKNLELAKTLIQVRGGPKVVLASDPSVPSGSTTVSSRSRLFLEILAVYDVAGCLATGEKPKLLSSGRDDWWTDESSPSSFEPVFGLSRHFVSLLARITSFLSRVAGLKAQARGLLDQPTDSMISTECRELFAELETWVQASNSPNRVHLGNVIYAKACQILLLREVLEADPKDRIIQLCAQTVLGLCLQCATAKMGVDLIWPVIIAGSHMYDDNRSTVLDVFEAFRVQCCYEVDTAERIVQKVWQRRDEGSGRQEWRQVMKDLNLSPLMI